MAPQSRTFRIESAFSPATVFQLLRKVAQHPNQRDLEPEFEFDWLQRRIALSANSTRGLETCVEQFLHQVQKGGGDPALFLPAAIEETPDGRFTQSFGVTLQEPAVFAQLIGQTLVEMGFHNVRLDDSPDAVTLTVKPGPLLAQQIDFRTLVLDFPTPAYIHITEIS